MTSTHQPPVTSLTATTQAARADLRQQFGTVFDEFEVLVDREAADNTIPSTALAVGVVAPSFELPDARGGTLALADILARGPAVVLFYRGAWCPYCNLQLKAFRDALDKLTARSATLVAISPQTPDASLSFAEKADLPFPVLSDVGNLVAGRYGLTFRLDADSEALYNRVGIDLPAHNGDDSWALPTTGVFVVGTDGTIRYRSVDADHRWRVGPVEVLAALDA